MTEATREHALAPGDAKASAAPGLHADFEAALVRRAKAGEAAAFGELFDTHYGLVLAYLYRRTLDLYAAEELTSNAFFHALRSLPKYEPRPGVRFRSWLYRIATNELRMHWRGRRARPEPKRLPTDADVARVRFPCRTDGDRPNDVRTRFERFAMVRRAMDVLPEKYREALELRYFEGMGPDEIAVVLGKRPGTVKSLVHRGLAKLAVTLSEMGVSE